MNDKGQLTTIFIILAVLLIVSLSLSFLFFRGSVGEIEKISTGLESSKEGVKFGETIGTTNQNIIEESSKANNFVKYAIGFFIYTLSVSMILGTIILLIKILRKKKK